MKKFKNIALLGATALVGVVGFSACSSDDDPTGNITEATGETVKTAFTLSLANQVQTRMVDGAAQEQTTPTFLGIKNIQIFPFKTEVTSANASTTAFALDPIGLAEFSSFDYNDANAKVYNNVDIPLGTKYALFYGQSSKAGQDGYGDLEAIYDKKSSIAKTDNVDKLTFDLVPVKEDATWAAANTTAAEVITYLNGVATALDAWVNAESDATKKATKQKYATNWKAMEAGSTTTIAAAAADLYATVSKIEGTSTTTVGNALKTAIGSKVSFSGSDMDSYLYSGTWTGTAFPTAWNLPDGSVSVKWDAANSVFKYEAGNNDGLAQSELAKYTKPASLYYFANTNIKTSDALYFGAGQAGTKNWGTIRDEATFYAFDEVKASTRSVILYKQIQYAVGRLDVAVRIAPTGTIKDSGSGDSADPDYQVPQIVDLPDDGYPMSAVLVGGQKQVGWDFTPTSSTETYTIYDGKMSATGIAAKRGASYSAYNHTLVLQTKADEQELICVELTNTGKDFYGIDNKIIAHGTKFYLVAKLDPKATTTTGYVAGTRDKVFEQDYVTIANLTIGEKSLAKAYQVIPDLRSPKLEFGLSVDLTWQSGLTFEQNFEE